jgi:EAL domain-containing protein (putative c-di-GMP-specific phosphodiesterase class I)
MNEALRLDRDRYVAFAFAAADLLLELNGEGSIVNARGASQAVCGHDQAGLNGAPLIDLVADVDKPVARRLLVALNKGGRLDPTTIRMKHRSGRSPHVLLGGCVLPTLPGRTFLSVTMLPSVAASAADNLPRDDKTGLLSKDILLEAALGPASDAALPKRMTLIQLNGLSSAISLLPENRGNELMAEIGALFRTHSLGGDSAARLGDDDFGLIPGPTGSVDNAEAIKRDIATMTRSAGVKDGVIKTHFGSVDLALGSLSPAEATKALAYAVRRFSESNGQIASFTSLEEGLAAEVKGTLTRFADLQRMIEQNQFSLVFQPIVRVSDRHVHHYEALSRFADGKSPYETIVFGEDVGLVEQLDLSVCRMAIEALEATHETSVAVNISGRSIQSAQFRTRLSELLTRSRHLRERVIFELTESSKVDEIDTAAGFLRWLRTERYRVCLDDFGAGAAAYSYLRNFDVDFVKIDGPFLRAAIKQRRDAALVGSICRLCAELNCGVIGEMIETESEATAAALMGVTFGQGWLYGKPLPALPAVKPVIARAGRRKGASESWS